MGDSQGKAMLARLSTRVCVCLCVCSHAQHEWTDQKEAEAGQQTATVLVL